MENRAHLTGENTARKNRIQEMISVMMVKHKSSELMVREENIRELLEREEKEEHK